MSTNNSGGYQPRSSASQPGPPPGDEAPRRKPEPPPLQVIRNDGVSMSTLAVSVLAMAVVTMMICGALFAWLAPSQPDALTLGDITATDNTECTPLAPGVDCYIDGDTGCQYYRISGHITPRLSVIGIPLCGHYSPLDFLTPAQPPREDVAQYDRANKYPD